MSAGSPVVPQPQSHLQHPSKSTGTGTSAETSPSPSPSTSPPKTRIKTKSKSKLLTMISPTGHTRHKYKKWYHAVEKQPFQGHTIVVVTWHFVHHDERHSIVLCDDTYTMSRSLICDEKDTWCGNPDMGYWNFEWTMGSIADPIHCVIEMVPTLSDGYKYLLSINSVSFETARDIWMKQQSATEQIQSRTIETVIQPRINGSPPGSSRSISTKNIPLVTDPVAHRQWIETHWGRWCDYEKTKYGGHKTKVTWKFTIKSNVHQLVLHHSWLSGKRKLFLDTQGKPIMWQKPSILDRNKPFHHTFPIDGVDLTIVISKQLQKSAREHSCPYVYDLFIDSVPFDACTNLPSPMNAVEFIVPKHHVKSRMKRAHTLPETYEISHQQPQMTRPHTISDAASIATTAPASAATSTNPSARCSPNSSPDQHSRDLHDDWGTQFPSTFDTSTAHKPSTFLVSGQNGSMIPVANVLGVDDGNPFHEDDTDTGNPFLSPSPHQITNTTTSTTTITTAPSWTAHFD